MKKTALLLCFLVSSTIALQAQCTIAPSCTTTSWYCSTPATGSALPNAIELSPYSTVIQISLSSNFSSATIDSAKIVSVTGLPSGLSYSTNPVNGVINGGASGCILIAGTPASGTAGNYVATATVTIYSNLGVVHPPVLTWPLTVNSVTGIQNIQANSANIIVMPNPAGTQITLSSDFHFKSVKIFDALGNIIIAQEFNGISEISIALDKLNPGIYFVQASNDNRSITRKFIKE
ncbi:MAG TPA: T9SS type A sorting domain-containing protein [Bacteroidia bacterium]|jgi:hypothetical protein|nr:T9SS type A sorting domain-containing protein [Bacteroidia bacterium]